MVRRQFHEGAVSLFMVIFSMLVIIVVTVSFLRLMTTDQRQASNSDLAQSAYDSALAGVEDAKRALLRHQKLCDTGALGCNPATFSSTQQCNSALTTLNVVKTNSAGTEVPLKSSGSGSVNDLKLDQAYTCVKITPDTLEYVGSLSDGQSKVIPLKGEAAFTKVRISWFSSKDVPANTSTLNLPALSAKNQPLLQKANWPTNRPSVMRAHFMQVGSNFTLESFDSETTNGQSNANTVFLYPSSVLESTAYNLIDDTRRVAGGSYPSPGVATRAPLSVGCSVVNMTAGGYACSATLTLPAPIGGGDRSAFLRLLPFYKATHYKVELLSSTDTPVRFSGVQPSVDSTGRANDLFRRVEARVEMGVGNFPFPEAAVDVADNFCKDFTVTPTGYVAGPSGCTP